MISSDVVKNRQPAFRRSTPTDNDAGKAAHESTHSEIHGALGEKVKDCGDVPDGISPQNEESERVVIP